MCGRYTLTTPVEALAEEFGVGGSLPSLSASYNVAPSREVASVVAEESGERRLELLRWGLVPSWADDPGIGNRMINARSETASEKPSFRKAFKSRRCLILADGFYEWQKTSDGKQPFHIRMEDGRPFALAGLWEEWRGDEGEIRSCTILTTEPNAVLSTIHNRMPVILPRDAYEPWLSPEAEKEELIALLRPYPEDGMEAYPVDRFVNSPSNDDPRCVEPAA